MNNIRPLLVALQFLTLLPINFKQPPSDRESGYSLLYYPLVGLLIGLLLWCCVWICSSLSHTLAAALTLTLWVISSGGLHLDGLADSADGWLGGYGNREKTLSIMHDPYCGPVGVVTLVLILLLKFSALESLITNNASIVLMTIPLLGRSILLALFLTTPYVRKGGLGEQMVKQMPRGLSLSVLLLVIILILVWHDTIGLYILASASISFLLLRAIMMRRLNGTTGDTAGAMLELTETTSLLVAACL